MHNEIGNILLNSKGQIGVTTVRIAFGVSPNMDFYNSSVIKQQQKFNGLFLKKLFVLSFRHNFWFVERRNNFDMSLKYFGFFFWNLMEWVVIE